MFINSIIMSRTGIIISNILFLMMIIFNLLIRGNYNIGLMGPKEKDPKGIFYNKLPKSLIIFFDVFIFILIIISVQFFSNNYGSFN